MLLPLSWGILLQEGLAPFFPGCEGAPYFVKRYPVLLREVPLLSYWFFSTRRPLFLLLSQRLLIPIPALGWPSLNPAVWGRFRSCLSSWADSLLAFLFFHYPSPVSDLHKSTNWPENQQPLCTSSFLKASEPPATPWFLFHLSGTWRTEELMVFVY